MTGGRRSSLRRAPTHQRAGRKRGKRNSTLEGSIPLENREKGGGREGAELYGDPR